MIGTSQCFIITKPKLREIFAANFRDRIIHHLVINELMPYFESTLIDSCYSSRKGKGTLYGQKDLFKKIYQASEGYTKDVYIAKFDIKSFFPSINKYLLFKIVRKFILEKYKKSTQGIMLWLCEQIILNSPQINCNICGKLDLWNQLDVSKSLFTCENGIPIGNITSQWFANLFLHEFDMWASKWGLYGRFVDDFFLICKNKLIARTFYHKSAKFLKQTRELIINPNKIYIQHYKKGVKFIGAVIKPKRIYISSRTISNFYIKFKNNKVKSLPSYYGLKQYNSYKLILKLMKQITEKTYIADEGKVFQRTFDGFNKINPPIGYFSNLTLGEILVDSQGNKLETPIPDKIQYYEEIELPTNDLDTQELTETMD